MSFGKFAVVLDIMSIQKYIFSSNKLKDNLGASYLIEQAYHDELSEAYNNVLNINIDTNSWKDNKDLTPENPIGYIGGGNALIFFEKKENAIQFIKEWTKLLLIRLPGCTPISAVCEFDINNFNKSKEELFKKLRENKSTYITQTVIQRHGITSECNRTGLSSEILLKSYNEKNEAVYSYNSMVSNAKIEASKKSNNAYKKFIEKHDNVNFIDELELLGQKEQEKNYIAIVHIDGNDIGKRFKETTSLEQIRSLSGKISDITQKSFQELINYIVKNIEVLAEEFDIKKEGKNYSLPIRPIIIGGDDITFVCPGKLGIIFAKVFMENFENLGKDENLTSCAGVSIIKTKYPFYKGYKLAEDLCSNAKEHRKGKGNEKGSWLDFNISTNSVFDSLIDFRKQHFVVGKRDLLFRPYTISKNNEKSFEDFIKNSLELKKNFPNSKIKELREVLTLGEDSRKVFVNEQKERGRVLPKVSESKDYTLEGFKESKTPYFDMIELIEFYPEFLLN